MPLRNARPVTFVPSGVTDSVDGTDSRRGSMLSSADLVPSMHTADVWVSRPAAFQQFDFSSFVQPITGEALVEIGNRLYGFVATGRFPGKSEPFVYDLKAGKFVELQGVTAGNTPDQAPATGDWQPPTIVHIGAYTLFSHSGFKLPNAFGWIDQSAFSDTATGDTGYSPLLYRWGAMIWGSGLWSGPSHAGGTIITNLSKNVNIAGWRPGMLISDNAGVIPPGTRIAEISLNGDAIRLSQSTTGAIAGDMLMVQGGTANAPLWMAGNLSINPLPAPATAIALFNGRAEYAVANAVVFSDSGEPLLRTDAKQAITIQNALDITALTTQPFNNSTVAGGIVQAMLIWQADAGIWQLTGDPVLNNLALNFLSDLGTLAPLTIQTTPQGTRYIAPDGARIIQLDGTVSEPLSASGLGVAEPFINATYPSRMCASFNEDVYRVSVTGPTTIGGSPVPTIQSAEYWYHLHLDRWSGPHSFPASLITASDRAATDHGFLMFPLVGNLAAPGVWFSNTRQLVDSRYTENGKQLRGIYQTTLLPDTLEMFQNVVVETSLMLALPLPGAGKWGEMRWGKASWGTETGGTALVEAFDEQGRLLSSVTLSGINPAPKNAQFPIAPAGFWGQMVWGTNSWGQPQAPAPALQPIGTQLPSLPDGLWGTMVWGQSLWGAQAGGTIIMQRRVAWPTKLVFKQMTVRVSLTSTPRTAIGNLYLRYQRTGYMIQEPLEAAA